MLFSLRRLVPVVLLAFVGLIAGCGSNNKGKIEGKWKIISMPGDNAAAALGNDKMFIYFEFRPDGTTNVGLGSTDSKAGEGMSLSSGKYTLQNGDLVEFTGMSGDEKKGGLFGKGDKQRFKIKIDGDNMSITGTDGTAKLVRVK